ncbi:hypothetical protein [Calothrix sp. PCC 7507]|uniref:hypothetical protein n=1 Tax=Calothrix sp. PCC 7507 TaxID=99598 RepID=UPI00029F122C|nr:hypothetical protein [Calothrix sp. PCC 7507]AFY32853.1 hypothetical protein Cal7507_2422 [Calothrix sp. PCC 7507]
MNSFNQKLQKSLPVVLATACGVASLLAGTSFSAVASEQIATCPKSAGGGQLSAYIETSNFYIYLCQRRGKLFYTSTSKHSGKGIRSLPAYIEEGTGTVAKNGQYEYIVDGLRLEIVKNGKVLQTDPVIKYVSGHSH